MFSPAHDSVMDAAQAADISNLLSQVGEAVIHVDQNWVVKLCNDVYLANLGMKRSDVVGQTPFEFVPAFKRSIFYEAIEHVRVTGNQMTRIGFSTVLNRWLTVRVFPVKDGMVMFANDASESVVKQMQLAQKAVRDELTGIGNKLAMEQKIKQLVSRGQPFSVIVVGLDKFRDVNDRHGYAAGDMVLLEIVSTLQSATMSGETLYRLSGDEFAIVCDGEEDTDERAAAFIEVVKKPIALHGARLVLGACAGSVKCPDNGDEYELLVKRAGLALRAAKRAGRDSIAAYRNELEMATQLRAVLEGELRTALDGSQFTLMIQPKVSLSTGMVVGGEALIRWHIRREGCLRLRCSSELLKTSAP
jgi:diguanylate cyclase (GGDEF)-like protein